jgi:hypothetical protein
MWRTIGAIVVVATAGLALSLVSPPVAQGAIGDTFFIQGSALYSSGGVHFYFNAVVAGPDAGVYTYCSLITDGYRDDSSGQGGGDLSGCGLSGYVSYTYSGVLLTFSGDICVNSTCGPIWSSAFARVPTSAGGFSWNGTMSVGSSPVPTVPPTPEATISPMPTIPPVPTLPPSSSCNIVDTAGVCVNVAKGTVVRTLGLAGPQPSGSLHVVGRIDMYSLPLPIGGSATFPCVVLGLDATSTGGCDALGATRVSTVATLVDTYASGASPVITVGVCAATITATVEGFGLQSVPGNTIC